MGHITTHIGKTIITS